MPSNRMLPHSCVLRNYIGENTDTGKAEYQDSVLTNVKCEPISKSDRAMTGAEPQDRIRLFIFDLGSCVASENGVQRDYVSPEVWNTLSAQNRALAWTAADDKDRIVFDDTEYLLTSVERYCTGSKRMWHREVYGR